MKTIKQLILGLLVCAGMTAQAQVTVNSLGKLTVDDPSGTSNFYSLNQGGDVYDLDMENGDLVFRPNGSTVDYIAKFTDESGYPAQFYGRINAGVGVNGTLLQANGNEAIWYNGTYFSWGFGGSWNRFADGITIGDAEAPTGGGLSIHRSNPRIHMDGPNNSMIQVSEDGTTVAWPFWRSSSSDKMHMNNSSTWAGTQLVFDEDGESLGMGTANPETRLHVYSGAGEATAAPNFTFDVVVEDNDYAYISLDAVNFSGVWMADESNRFDAGIVKNGSTGDLYLSNGGQPRLYVERNGNVGIGTNAPAYKLQVAGDVDVTGELTAASDFRLKRDIEPIANATSQLKKLNPVSYNFRTEQYPDMDLAERHKMGLIAQEVEQVFPNLVSEGSEVADVDGETITVKSVNYMELVPVLVKSIQELEARLAEAEQKIAELEK